MTTPASLKALEDTRKALDDIRTKVQPLLLALRDGHATSSTGDDVNDEQHDKATATAGIALTLGTLRFMAQRLKGIPSNKQNATDPLRLELNRMRKLLVQVQSKATAAKTQTPNKRKSNEPATWQDDNNDDDNRYDDNDGTKQLKEEDASSLSIDDDKLKSPTLTPAAKRPRRRK